MKFHYFFGYVIIYYVICMEIIRDSWNKNDYKEFLDYLFEISDAKYKEFHSGLGVSNVIGVRTPTLKNIAKDIYKGNYKEFLLLIGNSYYEESVIYAFVICNIKDIDESVKYLEIYKNMIDNWASCDLFCSSYKIVKKNKDYFYKFINDNISIDNSWIRRLCFVILLSYYVEEEYLDDIFKFCDRYNTSDYYVMMSVAWLISVCFVKYRDRTLEYIKNNKLDRTTINKAISKINDSYRVSNDDKIMLNKYKK